MQNYIKSIIIYYIYNYMKIFVFLILSGKG